MVNHKVDLRETVDMILCALLSNDGDGGGGLVQWVKRKAVLLRPAPRWDGQPAGVPVEG